MCSFQLEPSITLDEASLVVSADAFAQMLFSPIFGVIADKIGQIRIISLLCAVLFGSGNAFYALLSLIPREVGWIDRPRFWAMILSRVIVGAGTSG